MNVNEKHFNMMDENTFLMGIHSPRFIDTLSWWNCLHVSFTLGSVLSGAIVPDRFPQEQLRGQVIPRPLQMSLS